MLQAANYSAGGERQSVRLCTISAPGMNKLTCWHNGTMNAMLRSRRRMGPTEATNRYGGDAPKAIPIVPKSESACGERAVPSARAALFCRRKTLWRQNFLICFRSGTRKRILRCCRRRSCREHTRRSGGGVRKDIAGRRALPAASHQTQAVRSARDKRSCPDSMISLRCIRSLLNSGIGKRTVR